MENENEFDFGYEEEYNPDAWIDSALHAYQEGSGYGEWDVWQAQYDVADMDIYC